MSTAGDLAVGISTAAPHDLMWRGKKLSTLTIEELQSLVQILMLRDLDARVRLHEFERAADLARLEPRPWWRFWR